MSISALSTGGLRRSRKAASPRRALVAFGVLTLAACGGGDGGGGGPGNGGGMPGPSGPVTISGKAQYQRPPPGPGCQGLRFDSVELRPIRQATVELLSAADDTVLDSGATDDTGAFSLTGESQTNVYIRVRAELKRTGTPSWDVEVRDNTVTESATGAPLGLPQRPLYVLDTAEFDTGTVDMTRDITALTGWNASTSSYTGTRSAAPFAVLDVAYSGIKLVLGANPQATFEPLDIFWSVNNRPTQEATNIDIGHIGTSHYQPGVNRLFLLGDASTDPDEFDDHVVAHEWGHYYEDTFSRSDSIGGAHSLGDLLDMRVAFGEGWATALSGMALDDPIYCDTTPSARSLRINIEGQAGGTPGWFNEISVMKIVYDLWDTVVDGADTGSVGFEPIHAVMTGPQATTPAFTSIFSFIDALRTEEPAAGPLIDSLLAAEQIEGATAFGEGETNDGGSTSPADVLPVYTAVAPDGVTREFCSSSEFDPRADGNKLAEHRFLRMNITTPAQYHFEIITTNTNLPEDDPQNDRDQSDPDIRIFLQGDQVNQQAIDCDGDGDIDQMDQVEGLCPTPNREVFTTSNTLQAGDYVMTLVEFRYQDPETVVDYPPRTCFDVTITEAP